MRLYRAMTSGSYAGSAYGRPCLIRQSGDIGEVDRSGIVQICEPAEEALEAGGRLSTREVRALSTQFVLGAAGRGSG